MILPSRSLLAGALARNELFLLSYAQIPSSRTLDRTSGEPRQALLHPAYSLAFQLAVFGS